MKSQTVNKEQTAQEYLTVGVVFMAGGVMFLAGSQQLTSTSLHFLQILAVGLIVLGSALMGGSVGLRRKPSPKAPARVKTAAAKKRNGGKK